MRRVSADFGDAWERFEASDRVRLLQETLEWEWTRGRTDYVAFLIAVTDKAVRANIAEAIKHIADIPGIEPYPERYWHVTVKGVGLLCDSPGRPDEVSPEMVQRIAEEARPIIEAVEPFQIELGPVSGFEEVVFLEAHDNGAIRTLNQALADSVPAIPRYEIDGPAFLPHVSIARFASEEGLPELKRVLKRLRCNDERARFTVKEVLLVQAHLAAEAPTFDLLAEYKLRG